MNEGVIARGRWSESVGVRSLWITALAIAALHAFLGVQYLAHPAEYDEMYHMLAATGWLEHGRATILDGEYTRGWLYTIAAAIWMDWFRPTLESARLLSLVSTSLLAGLLVAFCVRFTGVASALVAGLLVASAPPIIAIGQTVRFYSLHALAFSCFAALIYCALDEGQRRTHVAALASGALVFLLLSVHLQPTTLIGLVGVASASLFILAPRIWRRFRVLSRLLKVWSVVAIVTLATFCFLALEPAHYLQQLRSGPLWSAGISADLLYYHHYFQSWYPTLWPLLPFIALVGLLRDFRLVSFCLIVFVVGFATFSIAATKATRYIAFLVPFFAIALGVGSTTLFSLVRNSLLNEAPNAIPWAPRKMHRGLITVALGVVVAAFMVQHPLFQASLRMLVADQYESTYGSYGEKADWGAVAPELRKIYEDHPIVVSSAGVKAIYYLGDLTAELNASVTRETDTGSDFGRDPRTGRPAFSGPEALERLISSCGPGMAIIESHHTDNPVAVPRETRQLLDKLATRREDPSKHIQIWTWEGGAENFSRSILCLQGIGWHKRS